ncbi:hypothetical protein [Vibrio phage 2 TSL-2019]|uniref:Uncharacterized protein n=1 Tax=Vibrio phage 2 TSL-2019 TaxID=2508172 RepID=A0A513PW58_9CAUD|nr:hypothetical protein HWC03_gp015 [Vibrio phage 2 TSL-2019]QAU04170.1 hypothetical protein [Vibrio phage 2 TSL-2019]
MFNKAPEKLPQGKLNFIVRPLVKHWILEAHWIAKESKFNDKLAIGICGYRNQDILIGIEPIEGKPDHYLMKAKNIPFLNGDWEVEVHKHVSLATQRIPEINEVIDSSTSFGERELLSLTEAMPGGLAEIGISIFESGSTLDGSGSFKYNVHYSGSGRPLTITKQAKVIPREMTYDDAALETRSAIASIISAEIARYLPYEVEQTLMKNQIMFGDDRFRPVVLVNVPVCQNSGFSVVVDHDGSQFKLYVNLVDGYREAFKLSLNYSDRMSQLYEISEWIRGMCRVTEHEFQLISGFYNTVRSQPTHYGRMAKNTQTGEIDVMLDKDIFTKEIRVLLVPGE